MSDLLKRYVPKLHLIFLKTIEDGSDSSGSQAEEIRLVKECLDGNRKAQKKLFDILSPKMMALCMRYAPDRETAEDILQDGFVTLFTKLSEYKGNGSFMGYARKIFVNTALMYLRKTDALKLSDSIDNAVSIGDNKPTPVQNVEYKELLRVISQLPPDYRVIFNMSVIEGYSHKDISDALGIPEATSRSKLQRARIRLQEMLRGKK